MIRTKRTDISLPPFVANRHSLMRDTGRQVDWALVSDRYKAGSFAVTTTGAAANATVVPVSALDKAISKGTLLDFGGSKLVKLSADAAAGATSLTVEAIGVALVNGDKAYTGGRGGKTIPAGTPMDLLASGKVVPSSLATAGVTCYSLIETGAAEDMPSDSMTGYGQFVGGNFYENLLPETVDNTLKTELRARGGAWQFFTYSDNT